MIQKIPPNEYKFSPQNYQFWFEYEDEIHEMNPYIEIPSLFVHDAEGDDTDVVSDNQNPNAGRRLMDVLGMTDEEADAAVIEGKWDQAREHREKLLADTDWSQGTDVPSSLKAKYATFRQALRDITDQSDPDDITWPARIAD